MTSANFTICTFFFVFGNLNMIDKIQYHNPESTEAGCLKLALNKDENVYAYKTTQRVTRELA